MPVCSETLPSPTTAPPAALCPLPAADMGQSSAIPVLNSCPFFGKCRCTGSGGSWYPPLTAGSPNSGCSSTPSLEAGVRHMVWTWSNSIPQPRLPPDTGSKLAKVPLPLDSQTQARGSGSAKRAQALESDGGAGGLQPRRRHRIRSSQWALASGGNVPGESIGQPSTVTSPSPGYSCSEDLVLV